jgi:hypothetical protein
MWHIGCLITTFHAWLYNRLCSQDTNLEKLMTKYICPKWLPAAAAMVMLAACSGEKKQDTLAQDTTLKQDLQMANVDTAAQPQLKDVPVPVPVAPAPVRRSPRHTPTELRTGTTASGNTVTRTPGHVETAFGTIAAGTPLNLSSSSRVCTNTNHVGDRVTAAVSNAVSGSNGATIPAGATATLEITSLQRSENMNGQIQMGFRVVSVAFGGHTYPLDATVNSAQVDRVRNEPTSKDVQKVGIGAAAGAVLGRIFGGSTKSTVIGGAVGAAAGAGTAVATANYEGCVAQGGQIAVSLNSPVQVHI